MEHRHFPRKPSNLAVKIITKEGKTYLGQLLETSTIGMRIAVTDKLPDRVKLVNVVLPASAGRNAFPARRLQMFIAWKDDNELGLCLVNERAKIDIDCYDTSYFAETRKIANQ